MPGVGRYMSLGLTLNEKDQDLDVALFAEKELAFCSEDCFWAFLNEGLWDEVSYLKTAIDLNEEQLRITSKECPCTNPDTTIVDETKTEQLSLF